MGNWAIVAIPEKTDPVWKHSSETVPHLTILSLGEHEEGPEAAQILSYMEHAADMMLHRFYMDVDRRGPLGPNDADVLFFNRGGSEIRAFRESLRTEPKILEWFNSSEQFPKWTPHLTMGWPEKPAVNEVNDDGDQKTYWGVHFDRIALWTGDYSGPEIELKSYQEVYEDSDSATVAMSDISHELAVIESFTDIDVDYFAHAATTIGDVIEAMNAEDRDIFDTIVGAALDGTVLPVEYTDAYDSFSDIEKAIMSFVVGSATSDAVSIEHSALSGEIEAGEDDALQFGVKGMKWGVRKSDVSGGSSGSSTVTRGEARRTARAKVKGGAATLGEAHTAGMKSTGHRTVNAVLGDKTHWKRAGIIAGVTAGAVGASFAVPALLPAGALVGVAKLSGATVLAGKILVTGSAGTSLVSAASVGQALLTGAGVTASSASGATAAVGNYANNAYRAVTGNKKVDASYAKLGSAAALRQTEGTKRIQKVLTKSGGLRKKDLKQSMDLGRSVSAIQTPIDADMLHSIREYLGHHDMELVALTGSIEVSDEDALQYGRKGMKWGVRHIRGLNGRVTTKEIPADAKEAIILKSKVKKAKGTHVLSNTDLEKLNKRINLENSYADLAKKQSVLNKTHGKVKTGLDLGKTVNEAIKFANSDAGKLLSGAIRGKSAGKHAK